MENGKKLKKIFDEGASFKFIETTKLVPEYVRLGDEWFELTGFEHPDKLAKRAKETFDDMKIRHVDGDILLVSHGGFISEFLSTVFDIGVEGMGRNFGKYKNCHISSILVDGEKKRLELMQYNKYLDDVI